MIQASATTLEFSAVQGKILPYAKTEIGRRLIGELTPLTTKEELAASLNQLSEMIDIVFKYAQFPLRQSFDLFPLITLAKKAGILTPLELDHFALDVMNMQDIIKFMSKIGASYPLIKGLCTNFVNLDDLERQIHRVIAPNLTIYDNASPELNSLRRKITAAENKISERVNRLVASYAQHLSDTLLTIRDGHYVLPVKTSDKNKVDGIIHDVSDSGLTTYIEPTEIVILNNELLVLKLREDEEIRRLLKQLSQLVVKYEQPIATNNTIIGDLDFLHSKAKYAVEIDGYVATISTRNQIHLPAARHPLIDPSKVIANSFDLTPTKRVIIISGPNAGGKTVALKTVGLLAYMHQSGLALPTSSSGELPLLRMIFTDIGDAQSLSDNLSTFSGHIKKLIAMSDQLTKKDLVLIDELGTGTDPLDGEALAIGIIEHIRQTGAFALISSHYSGLKVYASAHEGCENASMLFNEQKLEATYRLKIGVPGSSYGLEVARRLGLKPTIIDQAQMYKNGQSNQDIAAAFAKLDQQVQQLDQLQSQLETEREEYARKLSALESEKAALDNKKRTFFQDIEEEKADVIAAAKAQADAYLQALNPSSKMHEVIEVKRQLDNLAEGQLDHVSKEQIEVDDYVMIAGLDIHGRVSQIRGNKVTFISSDGKPIQVGMDKLVHVEAPKKKPVPKQNVMTTMINTDVKLELNIIGYHVSEGISELDRYLDTAHLRRFQTVRIIHGSGTGALRAAVHEYLKTSPYVDSFRLGQSTEGGAGATVVTLK